MAHNKTTAYHPQSNGMVERVHRQLKEGLAARGADTDWPDHLPWVLLNIRSTPKSDSNISAAEMVFGMPITLPAQPAAPTETPAAAVAQQRAGQTIPTRPASRPPPDRVPAHLERAAMVYVRKGAKGPLTPPYSGPYKVLRRGPKVFHIEVGGVEQIVTVDRLKPHLGAAAADPAAPPKWGRPPAARAAPAATEGPTRSREAQEGPGGAGTDQVEQQEPAAAAPVAPTAPQGGQGAVPGSPSNYKCETSQREAQAF